MARSLWRRAILVLGVALINGTQGWASESEIRKPTEWRSEKGIFVPMSDGIRLDTDVWLPAVTERKVPAILVRTPYEKDNFQWPNFREFLEMYLQSGYAVVMQNERGRLFSEGNYENYMQGARTDGYDTVDWIVKQPWSSGKVGTFGCSSSAEHQWPLAASNHPGHAAMIPMASGMAVGNVPGNDTRGAFYRGGVPVLNVWPHWYAYFGSTERFVLPPDSTQEQRVRLRNSFQITPKVPSSTTSLRHLPSKDILRSIGAPMSPWDNYITWTPADRRWDKVHLGPAHPRVPALHVDTWHDGLGVGETTRLFKYLQDSGIANQYLIIGAGSHCSIWMDEKRAQLNSKSLKLASPSLKVSDLNALTDFSDLRLGDLEVGDVRYAASEHGYAKLFINWYDYWLKGEHNQVTDMPKVQLHVMHQGWVSGDQWPLKETQWAKYYLNGERIPRAKSVKGTLTLSIPQVNGSDGYLYDPSNPVPSLGGGCCDVAVALDQRPVESRKDVLVYATGPLEVPVTIAGPVEVVLYVSSSAKDTDFIVKLVDIYPDGVAINLGDDAFRTRYREGFDKKVLMRPSWVYQVRLSNMVTAIRFRKGHRIGLQISSSDFPLYERNLNTGGNNYDETTWNVAENSVHHGPDYPSHMVLPVLPPGY